MIFDAETKEGAMALARLRDPKTRTVWLTSVTTGGQPQAMPVWFLWLEDEILVFGDHRAKRNNNLAANPRVNLHLNEDADGSFVSIDGTARIDPDHPQAGEVPAYLEKYGEPIDRWFKGPAGFSQIYSMPIRITPRKGRAFVGHRRAAALC